MRAAASRTRGAAVRLEDGMTPLHRLFLGPLFLGAAFAAVLAGPAAAQAVGSMVQGVTVVDGPIYVTTYAEVVPSAIPRAVAALKAYRDASRKEPGANAVDIYQEDGQSHRFVVSELWQNRGAVAAHGNAAAMKALADALKPIGLGPLDPRIHQAHSVTPPKAPAAGSIFIISHADVAGGNTQNLIKAFAPLSEESRKDSGMLRYEILDEVPDHVNHFRLFEEWTNMAAFEAHNRSAHTQTFRQTIQQWLGTPYDQRIYKLVN
jgi:quinol monooxygenase YgiN